MLANIMDDEGRKVALFESSRTFEALYVFFVEIIGLKGF